MKGCYDTACDVLVAKAWKVLFLAAAPPQDSGPDHASCEGALVHTCRPQVERLKPNQRLTDVVVISKRVGPLSPEKIRI